MPILFQTQYLHTHTHTDDTSGLSSTQLTGKSNWRKIKQISFPLSIKALTFCWELDSCNVQLVTYGFTCTWPGKRTQRVSAKRTVGLWEAVSRNTQHMTLAVVPLESPLIQPFFCAGLAFSTLDSNDR